MTTVPAGEIHEGSCFRKRTGTYVYLRISESAVRFYGLDPAYVYGVCYNGNIARLEPQVQVFPATIEDMVQNLEDERAWERRVGVKSPLR